MAFRVLPEYIVEDIVNYLYFAVQYVAHLFCVQSLLTVLHRTSPDKFELSGKIELLTFVLTFLTSTWYIKNPFLKSKINDVRPSLILADDKHSQNSLGLVHGYMGLRT